MPGRSKTPLHHTTPSCLCASVAHMHMDWQWWWGYWFTSAAPA
jgi:hypothetical protein